MPYELNVQEQMGKKTGEEEGKEAQKKRSKDRKDTWLGTAGEERGRMEDAEGEPDGSHPQISSQREAR